MQSMEWTKTGMVFTKVESVHFDPPLPPGVVGEIQLRRDKRDGSHTLQSVEVPPEGLDVEVGDDDHNVYLVVTYEPR